MIQDHEDAFGHIMADYFQGIDSNEIVERDDGYFDVTPGPRLYFSRYQDWPEVDKGSMDYVRGRVLDIGCGAGRHALYLQEKGFDVLGIDYSPLVIQVCRARGLRHAQVVPITQVSRKLGVFDTILMMGSNFGLLGNVTRARYLLRRFAGMTSPDARIIAQTRDAYQTDLPEHKAYHAWNRERGRPPGQVRVRVRYKKYVTRWFDLLLVSEEELAALLAGVGWTIAATIHGEAGQYTAVLAKA